MLSVAEASAKIAEWARPLDSEQAAIYDLWPGRVLAEDVVSDLDSPPFTKAMMDGYAVRAADCTQVPVELTVVDEIAAGRQPQRAVGPGEASRIMTGAPIPEGADAVVMVERTEALSATGVRIQSQVRPGHNVLQRASEMRHGETVLAAGALLGPQEIGLLATLGRPAVRIVRQPRVALLPTGDEIVEPPALPGPGQIRNSNGPMLVAQIRRSGAEALYQGVGPDREDRLRELIGNGLRAADVLILSGGVSAGKFDLVPGILKDIGVVGHFHKVLLKPGKPLFFGTWQGKLVFGLPGNPVSSFVCFELFIRPALRKMQGQLEFACLAQRLPIAAGFRTENDRPTYWPSRIERRGEAVSVRALPWQGSADLRALHTANALLVLAPGVHQYHAGQSVSVIDLSGT